MAQETRVQQGHLYEIAHRAQKKAVLARRRRIRRQARAMHSMQPEGMNSDEGQRHGVSTTQRRGMHGEDRAAHYLQDHGLSVLARNIHCRTGEIDLVVTDGQTLIFVEVRLRSSTDYGGAAASIDPLKRRRLLRTARFFMPRFRSHFGGRTPPCRFDVVSIDGGRLHWIPHAFDATT